MEKGTITLTQCLEEMRSGNPFDLVFVKADLGRGIAGGIKTVIKAVMSGKQDKNPAKQTISTAKAVKSPHHHQNSTLNLYAPYEEARRRTVKVHIRLITKINGQLVV